MNKFGTSPIPERNPETHKKYRQEAFWQITFPVLLGVIALLAVSGVMIWAGLSGSGNLSKWADVSLIWLILPVLVVFLLFLAVLGALVYAVILLLQVLPRYTYKAHQAFEAASGLVKRGSDAATEPVMRAASTAAGLRTLLRSLSRRRGSRRDESGLP
jgi:hypothetical protein